MRIVTIDIESEFSDTYTLKKMSTESYIRDSRFKAHGAGIKWGADYRARWYNEQQLRQILKEEDWSNTALLAHHMNFDGLILTHHYGVNPKLWMCTLSMARLCLGNHLSVSLDAVREHFKMPAKRTPYERFKGRTWHELDRETQELLAEGCIDEVESVYVIFMRFMRGDY